MVPNPIAICCGYRLYAVTLIPDDIILCGCRVTLIPDDMILCGCRVILIPDDMILCGCQVTIIPDDMILCGWKSYKDMILSKSELDVY